MSSFRRILLSVPVFGLLLVAAHAGAAPVVAGNASASLSLQDLQATVVFGSTTPAPGGAIANGSALVTASAGAAGDADFALDVFASIAASAPGTTASASSTGSATLMAASASAEWPSRASAESVKTAQVDFTGSGLLVVQLPYSLQIELSALADDTSFVLAEVRLDAFRLGSTAQYSSVARLLFDIGTGPGANASSGLLSLAIPFVDGDQYSVIAGVSAEIATTLVPLPAPAWLLGSGLVVLGVRRRLR